MDRKRYSFLPTEWRFISEPPAQSWRTASGSFYRTSLEASIRIEEALKERGSCKSPEDQESLELTELNPSFRMILPAKISLKYHPGTVSEPSLVSQTKSAGFPMTKSVLMQKSAHRYRLKPPDSVKPRMSEKREYRTPWYLPKTAWKVREVKEIETHDMRMSQAKEVYERLHELKTRDAMHKKMEENKRRLTRMMGFRLYRE